ncbi:aldo/keto reductase [Rhodococcus sp. NCIMB 12038]|uniref:aldo/keto reductase n=1 Tax=Rhodococcus sp. NCIMB 12038 TaxID=933800 RepID=UPI000B3D1774|nr:aldo/keto reductase [Rhodococcus sp. NCIMB 12038]OUS95446.1 hypothetical protein CA951_12475 [Rhodococcus sp. NCIMB 12038]
MMTIPPLGLGTWPLTGPEATRAVLSGIEAGYRLIDTAAIYGNEDAVGAALAKCGLPRDELFVTTKLRGSDHLSGDIRGAVLGAPAVTAIAERLGHSPAQVVLAWHRVQGAVPIVRSADPARQIENLAALDVRLTAGDVDALTRLDRGESAARDVETEEHF